MGIWDWLHASADRPEAQSGMSRRAFFARVAGQPGSPEHDAPPPARKDLVCAFYVARFPYHDGPILVPTLRTGLDFLLLPDPLHGADPSAVKILWGRDHLGYVPAEHSPEIRRRLEAREPLHCRSAAVDPGASLERVLWVEITREPDPEENATGDDAGSGEVDAPDEVAAKGDDDRRSTKDQAQGSGAGSPSPAGGS